MCASYGDKRKRGFFESSANKIFTGIREIVPEYAEKRAIWELFQNALDTVKENGIIEIAKTDMGLLFKHNGRPFTDDEFGGLINQYSVGKSYGDNSEKLGQYGTGFLSTHIYGKKIFVNGSLLTDDNSYRLLKNFEIDRDAVSIDELTDKLISQDDKIETLCDDLKLAQKDHLQYTSFEYVASDKGKEHIGSMLKYVETVLPYIFCFNDKLSQVKLTYDNTTLKYQRNESSDREVSIMVNNEPIKVPILKDKENKVVVVLANEERIIDEIPKQFLFYPLMDTGSAGYNFIIHANDFKPNRERDYLHKIKENEELKIDVEINESLLKIAFELALKRIKEDENVSIVDMAKISFTASDSSFEKNLKSEFIENIKDIKRLEFDGEKYALSNLEFFDETILRLQEQAKKELYTLLTQFRKIPPYETYCILSEYINSWNKNADKNFNILSLNKIAEIVSIESGANYEFINSKESYKEFIKQIRTDVTLLNKVSLIPNMHGDFKTIENLVKWENKETLLIEIINNINASVSEKYIHDDFEFLENINIYNREKFKEDFSKFCNELLDNLEKEKISLSSREIKYSYLTEYLNKFIGLNRITQQNVDLNSFYNRIYKIEPTFDELPSPTVEMNYQPAIKLLANLYIKDIVKNDVETNINDLKEIINIMYTNTNLKEELLHKMECIPNQNYCLKSQSVLKKDNVKDEVFKDEWNKILDGDIRNDLVFDGFECFLQHSSFVSGAELGSQIEQKLNSERRFIPVDKNIIEVVIGLIEKISSKPYTWGIWLREINAVKEEILMYKFQDESTRQSLFSILSVKPEKINLLGELAKIDNLSDLVRAGKEKQKEESRKSNHLIYINEVGLKIQDIIESELNSSLRDTIKIIESTSDQKLTSVEEQNGQDFIIYKSDRPIYYIEVKSRWDSEGIVALSKRQVERCANNKENYAVITVNVANYKSKNKIDIETISFTELKDDISVNLDLGDEFEKLIKENREFEKIIDNTKLIEFRGHIPQKRIETKGILFKDFIDKLKEHMINA
ncbi:uncharacterized protein DUF3883 [Chryseobacterium sp. CBTAP 102]|uniref:sacsin N-terminal ATP-binding-like domain-containing protein n=1 Tax=Chryseobacterium sp. CBTAP 102 TaxID=2135644 RepID=UPI000D763D12|nr:DUF3883 domain-containing protein [Chryseobacterium sp. CBTAP 102]PXW16533.1 uncharacterized protein DUF3883 [Chryseobacterium sp. CBTAP 102]